MSSCILRRLSAAFCLLLLCCCSPQGGAQQKTSKSSASKNKPVNAGKAQSPAPPSKAWFCYKSYADDSTEYLSDVFMTDDGESASIAFTNLMDSRYPDRVMRSGEAFCSSGESGTRADVEAKRAKFIEVGGRNNRCCQIPLPVETHWTYSGTKEPLNAYRQQQRDRLQTPTQPSTEVAKAPPVKETPKKDPCMEKWLAMVKRHVAIDYDQVCGKGK